MASKWDIVLFWFMNDWDQYGRAYEQIAKALKRHPGISRVACVFPPVKTEGREFFVRIEQSPSRVVVISLLRQSINGIAIGYRLRRWVNRRLPPVKFLRLLLPLLGFRKRRTILWVFPPHDIVVDVKKAVPHKRMVVQIVDNNSFKKYPDDRAQAVQDQYVDLAREADLVITSSRLNYVLFEKISKSCCFVENGVGSEFISSPSNFPCRITGGPPRLGYVGAFSERTDMDLLVHLATERPDWILVLAGPDAVGVLGNSELLRFSNVEYLSEVPQRNVPELLRSFDVCMIPHLDNPYSRSMSPLKLFQYLASGRPIVSTAVAGTERWAGFVEIGTTKDEFVGSIDEVLREDTIERSRERIAAVRAETWDSRVNELMSWIEDLR